MINSVFVIKNREKDGNEEGRECVCMSHDLVRVTWSCAYHMVVCQHTRNQIKILINFATIRIFNSVILYTISFEHNVFRSLADNQNYPIRSICFSKHSNDQTQPYRFELVTRLRLVILRLIRILHTTTMLIILSKSQAETLRWFVQIFFLSFSLYSLHWLLFYYSRFCYHVCTSYRMNTQILEDVPKF